MALFFVIFTFIAAGVNLVVTFTSGSWYNLFAAVFCFGTGCFLLSKYREGR